MTVGMRLASDKVMFEIYQDAGYDRRFRVVYFTELDEHNKEAEINRAMAGEHVFDGYLRAGRLDAAKTVIQGWLDRRNRGEPATTDDLTTELADFVA